MKTDGKNILAGFRGGMEESYFWFLVLATLVKRDFALKSQLSEIPRNKIQSELEGFLRLLSLFSLCAHFELLTITQINL